MTDVVASLMELIAFLSNDLLLFRLVELTPERPSLIASGSGPLLSMLTLPWNPRNEKHWQRRCPGFEAMHAIN